MLTNHWVEEVEKSGDWWIWRERSLPERHCALMAHFAFEQQLSEAVGGFVGYISEIELTERSFRLNMG